MTRVGTLVLLATLALGQGVYRDNWLARHQDASGAWMVDGKPDVGATGLSLLAFLGAGYTDRGTVKENRYAAHVRRGLRFLIHHRGANAREQAIATLTLCEAYWMTRDPRYKLPAVNGLAALDGGDDPVTRAFVVAALTSGRFGKLAVPQERLDREREWLDLHGERNPAATLFSRVFFASGHAREDEHVQRAVKMLQRDEPRDPMTWYFGTVGTFQVSGTAWKRWNKAMKNGVVETQRRDGSWDGGVEATALYMLCLCVYYRYDRVFGNKDGSEARSTGPRGRSSLAPLTSRIELDGGGVLDLETVSADVRVEGFRARVRLSLCFFHGGADLEEGKFQLRLPDGASPHTLAFGSTAKTALSADLALAARTPFRTKTARMVDRGRARRAYTTITSERRDPALLEWDGDGVFTARVFPLEPQKLHQVVIGYDLDLPPSGEFELVLPKTRRPCDVRIGDEAFVATTRRRFVRKYPVATVMTGGGYTGVRAPPDLPGEWTVEAATLTGCTDVLVSGPRIAARGEARAGAELRLRLRTGAETRTWSTTLPAPVASKLTPRVYGEIAVGKLEPFAVGGVGLPEAYARHFRVVRATCSLVMLESEKDYERFGIRAKDDAGTVRRVPVSPWLEGRRRATPKQRLRWRLLTLGRPTDLLEHVPDSDFDGLPLDRTADADLALACERLDRPRLGLVYDALARGRRREGLCAQILTTGREGFWFEYARKALAVVGHDLVVVLRWDTEDSDVDLHVVDPYGDVCNWRRRAASTGGRLSTDQVHGFGPEIYRLEQAEPGEYVIRVNYFRPAGTTRAIVVAIVVAIVDGKVIRASVELARRDQMVEVLRITIPER